MKHFVKKRYLYRNKVVRFTGFFTALALTASLLLPFVWPALAQPLATGPFPNEPIADYSTTVGTVRSILPAPDGSTYVAGDITRMNPTVSSRYGTSIDTGSALPDTNFAAPNGGVQVSISDTNGGWYIGGSFTEVSGITRNRLAHILPDGALDLSFNPNINNTVYALTLSPDGNTLYAGGVFTQVNGSVTRNRLAAFDISNGSVTSFNPNIATGQINTLVIGGSILYAGGTFTSVNGGASGYSAATRNRLAAFNTSTGQVTTFNPNINNTVRTLLLNGSILYAGGDFNGANSVNGNTTRNRLAAFNTTLATNNVTGFNPNINSGYYIYSLALDSVSNTIYAGGNFTQVNGSVSRSSIAAFDAGSGIVVSSFVDPAISGGPVYSLVLSPDSTTLYAGGAFSLASGLSRRWLAAFDTSNGTVTDFDPGIIWRPYSSVRTVALSHDGSALYIGGEGDISTMGGVLRNRLARILPDGTLDPNFNPNINNTVRTLLLNGSTLYAGGDFTEVDGGNSGYPAITRNRLAAFDTDTGQVTSFNPNINNTVNTLVFSPDDNTLYAGGVFTQVNGSVTRNRLAAFDIGSGLTTDFNPDITSSGVSAITLSPDHQTVYAGGSFTQVNGSVARNCLAAFNTSTGQVTTFNPNANSTVTAIALSPDGQTLYAGGTFSGATSVNGNVTRNYLAAFDANGGTVTGFDVNIKNSLANYIQSMVLSSDGSTLYTSGYFTVVNGSISRNSFAAFDTGTALVTDFRPDFRVNTDQNPPAYALSLDSANNRLYVGGDFVSVNNQSRNNLAAFQGPQYHKQLSNAETNQPVYLQTPYTTNITCSNVLAEASASVQDESYDYPLGLTEFCFDTDQENNEVSLTFVTDLKPEDVVARKYNSETNTYFDIQNAVITETTHEGQPALRLTYTITDNGDLDLDPEEGKIKDPVGLGVIPGATADTSTNGTGSTGAGSASGGLASTGSGMVPLIALALLSVLGSGLSLGWWATLRSKL